MNKNVTGICFSPTGTTRKIVETIALAASADAKMIDITKPADRSDALYFDETDYVVVGVPVYAGRVPKLVADYLTTVEGNQTPIVCVVVYGNREYDDALLELCDIVGEKGFHCHAASAFIGEHSFTDLVAGGRPDEKDLEDAKAFGEKALSTYEENNGTSFTIKVKGNHPYKERTPSEPMAPVTSDECVFCGLCSEACPVEAIDFEDYHSVNKNQCIRCCACIKACPKGAKQFDHPMIKNIVDRLITLCGSQRKSPEYFFAREGE